MKKSTIANVSEHPERRPWGAILTGLFLGCFGIFATGYGIFALTWTADTTSEIVQVEPLPTDSTPEEIDGASSGTQIDTNQPIRTSTTRNRVTPKQTTRTTSSGKSTSTTGSSKSKGSTTTTTWPGEKQDSSQQGTTSTTSGFDDPETPQPNSESGSEDTG